MTDSLYLPKVGHRVLERLLPAWTSDRFGTTGNLQNRKRAKAQPAQLLEGPA